MAERIIKKTAKKQIPKPVEKVEVKPVEVKKEPVGITSETYKGYEIVVEPHGRVIATLNGLHQYECIGDIQECLERVKLYVDKNATCN